MNQSMVTIVAPLDPARVAEAQAAIDKLGNPPRPEIAAKLRELDGLKGIHFVSLHALPSFTAGKAHLVLEMSSDGDEAWAVGWLASTIGGELDTVFALAKDRGPASIASYLAAEWPAVAGCVGVFRIEGLGVQLFESIAGDNFTVLGMPLLAVLGALREQGELAA